MANNITNDDLRNTQFIDGPRVQTSMIYRPTRGLLPVTAILSGSLPTNSAQAQKDVVTTAQAVTQVIADALALNYRGQWLSYVNYAINDVVLDNASAYIAKQASVNAEPLSNSSSWTLLSENLVFNPAIDTTTALTGWTAFDTSIQASGNSATLTSGSVTPATNAEAAWWIPAINNSGMGGTATPDSSWHALAGSSANGFVKAFNTLAPVSGSISITSQAWASNLLLLKWANGAFVANITATACASNVITVTAANSFIAGTRVTLTGLTVETYLNNVTATVLSASATQFTIAYTHANYGTTADTGTATNFGVIQNASVLSGGISGAQTLTFANSITAGSTIVVLFTNANSTSPGISSVTDTLGNSYAILNERVSSCSANVAYAIGSAAGLNTLTVTPIGPSTGAYMTAFELAATIVVTKHYEPFDVVSFGQSNYVCIAPTTADPTLDPASWFRISVPFVFQTKSTTLTANYNSGIAKTIITPTAGDTYRVSYFCAINRAATNSSTLPSLTLGYTDAGGVARTLQLVPTDTGNATTVVYQGSTYIYVNATAVTLTSASYASSGTTSMQYSLAVSLEQI